MDEPRATSAETEMEVQVVDHNDRLLAPGSWLCCVPCYWLRSHSGVHRAALSTATLLVTSLLVASPVLFLISDAPGSAGPRDCFQQDSACPPSAVRTPDCTHTSCEEESFRLRRPIAWGVEPCLDFVSFSCEGLNSVFNIQELTDRYMQQLLALNTSSGPFRKLGRFYGSCLRSTTKNVAQLFALLDQLGGYLPVGSLGPGDLTPLISILLEHGWSPLLDIFWDRNVNVIDENKTNILYITMPIELSDIIQGSVRFFDPRLPPTAQRVFQVNSELVTSVLDGFLPTAMGPKQRYSETKAILEVTTELSKLWTLSDENSFSEYNISTLQETFPIFQWRVILDSLDYNENDTIIVKSPKYFVQVFSTLKMFPNRVVHNSLLVLYATKWLSILNSAGHPVECSKLTVWALPLPGAMIYNEGFLKSAIRVRFKRAKELFDKLKVSLITRLSEAKTLLRNLKLQMQQWTVENPLALFENVEVSTDDFFNNVLKRCKKSRKVNLYTNLNKSNITYGFPFIAKAFYDKPTHSIVLPLSLIMAPNFDSDLPDYIHFAVLGNIIAKEIFEAVIQNNGRMLQFSDCVEKDIRNILHKCPGSTRGPLVTNMAAISLAHHVWGSPKTAEHLPGLSLNPSQLYYVATTQLRCLDNSDINKELLNGALSLQRHLAEAWQCPSGAPMTPPRRCQGL